MRWEPSAVGEGASGRFWLHPLDRMGCPAPCARAMLRNIGFCCIDSFRITGGRGYNSGVVEPRCSAAMASRVDDFGVGRSPWGGLNSISFQEISAKMGLAAPVHFQFYVSLRRSNRPLYHQHSDRPSDRFWTFVFRPKTNRVGASELESEKFSSEKPCRLAARRPAVLLCRCIRSYRHKCVASPLRSDGRLVCSFQRDGRCECSIRYE